MNQLTVDKITSTAGPCGLGHEVTISSSIVAEEGYCVAVRALEDKTTYNQVECDDGAFRTISKDDLLVSALGERRALRGYCGRIPRHVHVGDELNVLNMGGIIGRCTSDHPDLGPALRVEVLGAVMVERDGEMAPARIQDHAVEPVYSLKESAPLVMVSGTAMDTGKTYAASQIIRGLTERGLSVGAAKLTGAALMRDSRAMEEHGAIISSTFIDAGVVSSTRQEMQPLAKAIIAHVNTADPDIIVLELGDGFIGYYGVDDLLMDKEIQRFTRAHVVTASNLAGAWAADQTFRTKYQAPITVLTGPVTDNAVGKQYIQNILGVPALNARQDSERLISLVSHAAESPEQQPPFKTPQFSKHFLTDDAAI